MPDRTGAEADPPPESDPAGTAGGPAATVRPLLVMSVAVLMWSSNLVTGALLADAIPPGTLSLARQSVCFAVLLPVALPHLRGAGPALRRHWRLIGLMGLLALAVPHTAIYAALHTTQSVNVALMNAVVPVFVLLLAWAAGRGTVGLMQMAGIALSLAGALVIILRGDIAALGDLTLRPGDLLALLAALSIATYTLLYTGVRLGVPPLVFLCVGAGASTAALAPVAAAELVWTGAAGLRAPDWTRLATVIYLGIGPSALAVACWNWGLARVGAARGSQMVHLIPVCTALLAVLALDERLHAYHFAAFAAIVAGIAFTNRGGATGAGSAGTG